MLFCLISKKKSAVILSICIAFCLTLTVLSCTVNGTYVKSKEDRILFLKNLGYTADEDYNEEVTIITVPLNFNQVYKNYNDIQIKSGYNLLNYRGEELYQYTIKLKNFKSSTKYENNVNDKNNKINENSGDNGNITDDDVYAHILCKDKKIVGGDIMSVALNGFMKGLTKCD